MFMSGKLLGCFLALGSSLFIFNACNTTASKASALAGLDTIRYDEDLMESSALLMDKLDSLNKGLISFPAVDSLNKITPKQAKQLLKDSIYRELRKKPKHIYLTFDDGPLLGSDAIDSIATQKQVKISAFLIGKHARMSKRLTGFLQRYLDNPLVEAYNHSYTHAHHRYQTFYADSTGAFADFAKAQEDMGLTHKVARLPGRNIWRFDGLKRSDSGNGATTAEMLYNSGYKVFGWDVEWRIDVNTGKSAQSVSDTYRTIRRFLDKNYTLLPNNVVVLMHDDMFNHPKSRTQLRALIDSLKQHPEYHFEFMSAYPKKY